MHKSLFVSFAIVLAGCSASTPFYSARPVAGDDARRVAVDETGDDANVVLLATQHSAIETSIAISPKDPDNIVVGSMGYREGERLPWSDVHFSRDGGKTWQLRTLSLTDSTGTTYGWHSDPVVAADKQGTFYYATMLISRPFRVGMAVSRSDDGGDTWTTPVSVAASDGVTVVDDKEWLAVDDTDGPYSGNVYLMWGHYYKKADGTSDGGEIVFSRSTDRGETWTTPMPLTARGGVGMSMLAIGPNGEVYASFNDGGRLRIRVSRDGGQTFSPSVIIPASFGPGGKIPNTNADFSPMPTMAADRSLSPYRGTLYFFTPTRGAQRPGGVAAAVGLYISRDEGQTWSGPKIFNDVPRDSVFPMISVDQRTGDVVASWLDRRDDPSNTLFRVYATRSTDGGWSWETPRPFSSSFSLDRPFLGHYLWNAAHAGRWLSTFTTAEGRMSVAHLDFSQPQAPQNPKRRRRSVR